jgi:hypothetical protein
MRTPSLPALLATLTLTALAAPAPARAEAPPDRLSVSLLSGGWFAAGAQRHELADAPLLGVQAVLDLCPWAGLVGTFTWVPTSATRLGDARVDLLQYDLGLRAQHDYPLADGLALRPFAGVGFGARTVAFHDPTLDGGTGFAWYSAAGLELRGRSLVGSLSARHQLSSPNTSALGDATRADVAALASLGLRF